MKRFIVAVLLIAACGKTEGPQQQQASTITINGAGATFPNPIYSKWFSDYNKAHPNIQVNYQSIGSGGGIKQLSAQTMFFGASDMPMTDEQLKAAPGPILHFPTVLGAVVPAYNVGGVSELKFAVVGPGIVLALAGAIAAPFVVERMSDHGFRQWTRAIIFTIAVVYLIRGGLLLWQNAS